AGDLFPGGDPGREVGDRRERAGAQLLVDASPREIVDDVDVMAAGRKVERRGPTTEPVAAEDEYAHHRSRTCDPDSSRANAGRRSAPSTTCDSRSQGGEQG